MVLSLWSRIWYFHHLFMSVSSGAKKSFGLVLRPVFNCTSCFGHHQCRLYQVSRIVPTTIRPTGVKRSTTIITYVDVLTVVLGRARWICVFCAGWRTGKNLIACFFYLLDLLFGIMVSFSYISLTEIELRFLFGWI